jgi:hypothetical protein
MIERGDLGSRTSQKESLMGWAISAIFAHPFAKRKPMKGKPVRRVRLALEELEGRLAPSADGLSATYFDHLNFIGPTVNRVDPTIAFNWGTGSPAPGIGPGNFSVVWQGELTAIEAGTYHFQTNTSDGVRLWVNASRLINMWSGPGTVTTPGVTLAAGQSVPIRMEYYDATDPASASLSWERPGQSTFSIIPQSQLSSTISGPVPAVFQVSDTANPGDLVSIQGDGFGSSPQVYYQPVMGTPDPTLATPLTVVSASNIQVTAQVPANAPAGTYAVWVENGTTFSQPVYVNQPRADDFDTPEVASNETLRIFGCNLVAPGTTPSVRLYDPVANSWLTATVNTAASDAYALSATAPSGVVAGRTYSVFVKNDNTIPYDGAETQSATTLLGRAAAADPFSLGVGWGMDFALFSGNVYNVKTDPRLSQHAVGDGVANDQAAIQAAINTAHAAGGGVVYLPAGTYKLIDTGSGGHDMIDMKSNVVLQGAGQGSTIVQYGYDGTPVEYYGVRFDGASYTGMVDLTINNVSTSTVPSTALNNMSTGLAGGLSRLFLQRVTWNLGLGATIVIQGSASNVTDRVAVENSTFTQAEHTTTTIPLQGCLYVSRITNLVFSGNSITVNIDGLNIDSCKSVVFENNNFTRDLSVITDHPDVWRATVFHCIAANFDTNLYFKGNTFNTINGTTPQRNDGETLETEGGGPNRRDYFQGTATGGGATTLVDANGTIPALTANTIVALVGGTGAGQWRRVVSSTATSLTVDQPWDVAPDTTTQFSVFEWSDLNWIVQGNTITNQQQGIIIYAAESANLAVVGNTLTNSEGIFLRPDQRIDNTGVHRFDPIFHNLVADNTITNTDPNKRAILDVEFQLVNQNMQHGTGVFGVEFRRNQITGVGATTQSPVSGVFEGITARWTYTGSGPYVDTGVPAVLGTIVQGNDLHNVYRGVYLSTGSYQTAVWNNTTTSVPQLIEDDTASTATHRSVGTVLSVAGNTSLPNDMINTAYSDDVSAFSASLGVPSGSYAFALWNGSQLPAGLTLSSSGVISGTPTVGGAFNFVVAALDSTTGFTVLQTYTISVFDVATHLNIVVPATATAGAPFDVTVQALDANNQLDTGYTGTVHFSSADPYGAGLPSDYTFSPADAGVHTFSAGATLYTAGTWDVTAADAGGGITGSANVTVTPAAADHLVFNQQPSDTVAGQSIGPTVTVAIVDQFGNVLTGDNTDSVTVAIGNNPSGGTLSGTLTVTVSNGVASFGDLSIDMVGDGYTLHVISGSLTAADSNAFSITM